MREILFRGKDIAGNWHYGVPLVFTEDYVCITAPHTYNKKVEANTTGQYTGLTDKNGKKIFEGDIVKAMYHIKENKDYVLGTVVFENGTFKLSVFGSVKKGDFSFIYSTFDTDKKSSKYAIENNFIFRDYYLEVIGNIHDNPELLKGGAEL